MIFTVYVVVCVLLYFVQNRLVFPGASDQGTPDTAIDFGGTAELLHFKTKSGCPIGAVFGAALLEDGSIDPDTAHRPTILYFYGNGSSAAWSQNEFDHFRRLDANVLIPDLCGYGASGGKLSEKGCYATADASWEYLMHRPDIDQSQIVAVGWSLGAGIAIDLAKRKPVAALATFNAFTTLPSMAHHMFPWVPTSLLLKYRFDNAAKLPGIRCPTFICNGACDTLVPPEMSDQLARLAGGTVTRLVVPSAGHNSIFTAEPEMVWPALGKFIEKLNAHPKK